MPVNVKFSNNFESLSRSIVNNLNVAVLDVTLDVKRVSSAAAPHKSGNLEKNRHRMIKSGGSITGEVSFNASNKGFDYAKYTHDEKYQLGKRSKRKSGGKSGIGGGSVPVGSGYLANTIERNKEGYQRHFTEALSKAIR